MASKADMEAMCEAASTVSSENPIASRERQREAAVSEEENRNERNRLSDKEGARFFENSIC